MKHELVYRGSGEGASRLILFFAGWGMDSRPFGGLRRDGYDVMVVWDYRTLDFDQLPLSGYGEIYVFGWSFGVIAAAEFIHSYRERLHVTRCVAISGTLCPVDDERGIPESIFKGTLEGLDESSLSRFYRRMCGGAAGYKAFSEVAPRRDIEELKDELRAIAARGEYPAGGEPQLFDAVYISGSDRIIPTANQHLAWKGHCNVNEIDAPHIPDFSMITGRETVPKDTMACMFSDRASTYDENACAQHRISRHLVDMWCDAAGSDRNAGRVLEIGVGTGAYTRMYLERFAVSSLELWDIAPGVGSGLPVAVDCVDAEPAIAEVEAESYDVITSASAMQWFNSPMRFMWHMMRALAPGGLAVVSTFGPATLGELSAYRESALRYPDVRSIERMAKMVAGTGDEIRVATEEIVVNFADTRALVDHLRLTGVNAGAQPSGVPAMRRLMTSGLRKLTYQPIYVLMRKRK